MAHVAEGNFLNSWLDAIDQTVRRPKLFQSARHIATRQQMTAAPVT
jgi:hypothetical protein